MVKSTRQTGKSANRFPAPASSRNAENRVARFVVQALTRIHDIRAFGSQLLCEQVVGRALHRMNYRPTRTPACYPKSTRTYTAFLSPLFPSKAEPWTRPRRKTNRGTAS